MALKKSAAHRSQAREVIIYFLFLSSLLALFFWPVLFQGYGYFHGDYKQQFYPWAYTLSRDLRSFSLPLWAHEIGCGFPLLAEGQSAALYPLNWILLFFLPFPFSYHAGFIVLFLLAGFFSYLFFRECGMSALASGFASSVFLFSSAYAGLFYGLMALRVLAWFPLSLYWIERLSRSPEKTQAWVWLAGAWAMGFLGGYPQMAVYAVFAGLVYSLLKSLDVHPGQRIGFFMRLAAAVLLGVGLSAAQILPTLELALQSGRAGAGLDFALQKSFNPLNLATLLWPGFGAFMGFDFYIGVAPFVLAFFALGAIKEDKRTALFAFMAAFFIFLALGRFNPAYVALLKASGFYSFRVPSKFIYFSCFFLAALSGVGLDRAFSGSSKVIRSFLGCVKTIFFAAAMIFFSAWIVVHFFRTALLEWGQGFVRQAVLGKAGHPHQIQTYFMKVEDLLDLARQRTDLLNPYVLTALGIWAALIFTILALKAGFFRKRTLVLIIGLLTIFDLYRYMFFSTGFYGNRKPKGEVIQDATAEFLSSQKGLFRTYEVSVAEREFKAPRWLPNSNMLFGYSSVGIYSPLVKRDYREALEGSGAVDDAMGSATTSKDYVAGHLDWLGFMNARYFISRAPLEGIQGLEEIFYAEGGDHIYLNHHWMPRAFWAAPLGLDGEKKTAVVYREGLQGDDRGIRWVSHEPQRLKLETESGSERFLFLSESYDPEWRATIDGNPAQIYQVDRIFKGVLVPKGSHRIELFYEAYAFKRGAASSLLSLLACGVILCNGFIKERKAAS